MIWKIVSMNGFPYSSILNGMKSLGKSLEKFQGLLDELSNLPSVNTYPRNKENKAYNNMLVGK
jgi:hypothetical protein